MYKFVQYNVSLNLTSYINYMLYPNAAQVILLYSINDYVHTNICI